VSSPPPAPSSDLPAAPPHPPPDTPRSRRGWLWLVGLAALVALAWGLRRRATARTEREETAREAAARDRPVPVLVARVERRDVPIRLEAIGTVSAYATVTVRPRLATGRLAVIDNQINEATATVRLKAVFDNPGRRLWPSQFVKARLLVSTRRGALVVPAAAVQRGPRGVFVYVVGGDGRVAMRPVRVEHVEADRALVADGLVEGEQVVTEGQGRLRAGARAQPRTVRDGGAAP